MTRRSTSRGLGDWPVHRGLLTRHRLGSMLLWTRNGRHAGSHRVRPSGRLQGAGDPLADKEPSTMRPPHATAPRPSSVLDVSLGEIQEGDLLDAAEEAALAA